MGGRTEKLRPSIVENSIIENLGAKNSEYSKKLKIKILEREKKIKDLSTKNIKGLDKELILEEKMEALGKLKAHEKRLLGIELEKNNAKKEISKSTLDKLDKDVKEFSDDLKGMRAMLKSKNDFSNYSELTKTLRSGKIDNEIEEKIYELFNNGKAQEKIKEYFKNTGKKLDGADFKKFYGILSGEIKIPKKVTNVESEKNNSEKEFLESAKKFNQENIKKYKNSDNLKKDFFEFMKLLPKINITKENKEIFRISKENIEFALQSIDKKGKGIIVEGKKIIVEGKGITAKYKEVKAEYKEVKAEYKEITAEDKKDKIKNKKWYKETFGEALVFSKEGIIENNSKVKDKIESIKSLIGINDNFTELGLKQFKDFVAGKLKIDDAKDMLRQFSMANIKKAIKESLTSVPEVKDVVGETTGKVKQIVSSGNIETENKAEELKKNLINIFGEQRIEELYSEVETEIERERLNKAKILPRGKELFAVIKKANIYKNEKGAYSVGTRGRETGFSIPVDIKGVDELKKDIKKEFDEKNRELFEDRGNIQERINELNTIDKDSLSVDDKNELTKLEGELESINKKISENEKVRDKELELAEKKLLEENNEKIEKAARIANFLEKIGWDLITETNRGILLNEFKKGNVIIDKSLDINTKNIDINNGVFGEVGRGIGNGEGNLGEKTFAKMMNKIITGRVDGVYKNKEGKIKRFIDMDSIGQDVSANSKIGDNGGYTRSDLIIKMKDNGMYDAEFTLEKAKENLSKEESVDESVEIDNKILEKLYDFSIGDNYSENDSEKDLKFYDDTKTEVLGLLESLGIEKDANDKIIIPKNISNEENLGKINKLKNIFFKKDFSEKYIYSEKS